MSLGTNSVDTRVTSPNTGVAGQPSGQQVVLLNAYAGTAAATGTTSVKVGAATKAITVTLSNVTSVGGASVAVQGSNDSTAASAPTTAQWTTLTTIASTVTTQTSYSSIYTDTTPWLYYRANVAANASTNTYTVVLSY